MSPTSSSVHAKPIVVQFEARHPRIVKGVPAKQAGRLAEDWREKIESIICSNFDVPVAVSLSSVNLKGRGGFKITVALPIDAPERDVIIKTIEANYKEPRPAHIEYAELRGAFLEKACRSLATRQTSPNEETVPLEVPKIEKRSWFSTLTRRLFG